MKKIVFEVDDKKYEYPNTAFPQAIHKQLLSILAQNVRLTGKGETF